MKRLETVVAGAVGALMLMMLVSIVLLFVEGSVGHDGLLCEWGYDTDGDGATTSGCY